MPEPNWIDGVFFELGKLGDLGFTLMGGIVCVFDGFLAFHKYFFNNRGFTILSFGTSSLIILYYAGMAGSGDYRYKHQKNSQGYGAHAG